MLDDSVGRWECPDEPTDINGYNMLIYPNYFSRHKPTYNPACKLVEDVAGLYRNQRETAPRTYSGCKGQVHQREAARSSPPRRRVPGIPRLFGLASGFVLRL